MAIPLESVSSERGLHSGPQAGAYFPLIFTTGATLATLTWTWKAPFPCRIVHVSADAQAVTSTTYAVTTTTGNVIAARAIPTTVEEFEPGGSNDLDAVDEANRSLADGDLLTIPIVVTTSATGVCIVVMLYATGHPAHSADLD